LKILDKIIAALNKVFVLTAGIFLSLMVIITCLNIVLRLMGTPLRGAVELMGFFGAVTATFALAYTQMKKDHISVTILVDYFPVKVKKCVSILNDLLCMVFSLIAALQISSIATAIFEAGEVTETLRISFYPFVYAAAAGFFLLVLIFLGELLKVAVQGFTREPDAYEKEFEAEGGSA
jgi:TRAP-type C4-dicarboxylate transport system permease small subunit